VKGRRLGFRRRSAESGYAYLMAFFLITVVLIGSEVVLRNMAIEAKREREAEMIWRGNQYVRAIRLYYRKSGHYPQSLDDLEKGVPDLHFLRPATLKEPMNRTDGSWRLIYTNASGQIIGSVRYATMQQMALMDLNGGKMPSASQSPTSTDTLNANSAQDSGTASSAPPTPASGAQNQGQQPAQSNSNSPFGVPTPTAGASGPGNALLGSAGPTGTAIPQLQPTGPVDGPVLGAFVAGVAGGNHYDGNSVKVYKGGKTYQQWEFIWNPLEDQARALQSGLSSQPGAGQQPAGAGLPIANPNGGAPTPPLTAPPSGAPQPTPEQPQPSPQP
jgi:hypothetical protein